MYKTMGVYVLIATPLPVANFLTADNNDARKPPTISYMWVLAVIKKTTKTDDYNEKRHFINYNKFNC